MRRRRCGKARRSEWALSFAVAFGLGLLLALLCSARFALLLAAGALILIGINCRR